MKEFKIKKLLLEGGGKINGAMLGAGLIDGLSLLVAPVADGSMGTPTLFDLETPRRTPKLELLSTRKVRAASSGCDTKYIQQRRNDGNSDDSSRHWPKSPGAAVCVIRRIVAGISFAFSERRCAD
jgi:hypothetical protein